MEFQGKITYPNLGVIFLKGILGAVRPASLTLWPRTDVHQACSEPGHTAGSAVCSLEGGLGAHATPGCGRRWRPRGGRLGCLHTPARPLSPGLAGLPPPGFISPPRGSFISQWSLPPATPLRGLCSQLLSRVEKPALRVKLHRTRLVPADPCPWLSVPPALG